MYAGNTFSDNNEQTEITRMLAANRRAPRDHGPSGCGTFGLMVHTARDAIKARRSSLAPPFKSRQQPVWNQ